MKPEGHSHWKTSDSKFGTHEAFLTQGPLEQEFYSKEKNNSRDTKVISMRHLYISNTRSNPAEKRFRGSEFCLCNFPWWIKNYKKSTSHNSKKFKGRVLLGTTFFWLVGFFRVLLEKTVFGWPVVDNFSNQLRTWLKWLKTMGSVHWTFRRHRFPRISRPKTFREMLAWVYETELRDTCKQTTVAIFMQLQQHFLKWMEKRSNVFKCNLVNYNQCFTAFSILLLEGDEEFV